MEFKSFQTDESKENEGVWVPVEKDVAIKIARAFNKHFVQRYRNLPRAVQKRIQDGTISSRRDEEVFCELLAETVVVDWKGFTDDGKLVPFSRDNAEKFLLKYKEFRAFAWELANDMALFKLEENEDDAKNSKRSFDGN